jgi:hypothetical protein
MIGTAGHRPPGVAPTRRPVRLGGLPGPYTYVPQERGHLLGLGRSERALKLGLGTGQTSPLNVGVKQRAPRHAIGVNDIDGPALGGG